MDTPKNKLTVNFAKSAEIKDHSENIPDLDALLTKNLVKENTEGFSLGFSNHLIRKIEVKQQRQLNVKLYCLAGSLLLICIPLLISFVNSDWILSLFSLFLKHKFLFAFSVAAVILIQFGEKLINRKNIRNNL